MKTKNFYQMFAVAFVFGFLAVMPQISRAQSAAATFPVNEAGITAYAKLDSISQTNFDKARQSLFDSVESFGDTYMIGVKGYLVDGQPYDQYANNRIEVYFYLGADGWLAAYLTKDDPVAKIVNWRPGAELKNTLLKVAFEDAIAKIGAAATGEIKYYDFSSPASSKMTMVKEFSPADDQDGGGNAINYNEFSATMKGTLNRFSWGVEGIGTSCPMGTWGYPVDLLIDSSSISGAGCSMFTYGGYNPEVFSDQRSHMVRLNKGSYQATANGVFVFIYGN